MNIVLASASIRRQELLERLIEKFQIMPGSFDEESVEYNGNCGQYVMELSFGKAQSTAAKLKDPAIVIGCDTVVAMNGVILGKPSDYNHAYEMLKMLSGKRHQVYSGITIINTKTNESLKDFVLTEVKFSELSDEEIKKYIKTGEPLDKAGAYGIQGLGGIFVEEIQGCYYNVVGLPLNKLKKMLIRMGVNL